jgi:hypothetical protein
VTHACNPSHSGGRDQEDRSSKPAWANSSQDPISKKIPSQKRAGGVGGVAQGVGPEFKPQSHKKKKVAKINFMFCVYYYNEKELGHTERGTDMCQRLKCEERELAGGHSEAEKPHSRQLAVGTLLDCFHPEISRTWDASSRYL